MLRRTNAKALPNEPILLLDSGADQFLAGFIWRCIGTTGRHVNLFGALAQRHSGTVLPVCSVAAKIIDRFGNEYCGIAHEALLDKNPNQFESLLPPAQARKAGNRVDDCPTDQLMPNGSFGTQCCVFNDTRLPLFHDGDLAFYRIEAITDEEMKELPRVFLTSGDEDYEPTSRAHTRRMNIDEVDWKRTLAFPPDDVLKDTLAATTQLIPTVEAESRMIMRDHLKTRLSCLRYRRRRDTDYLDTFKASIKSVRGFHYFNLFCGKKSNYDHPVLMHRKHESVDTLDAHFEHCGVPTALKSDNAKEFKSRSFTRKLRKAQVKAKYTELHHPNQNLAEPRGGRLKHLVQHILLSTGAPPEYWCYCLEYVAYVKARTAKRNLGNRTPFELEFGAVPDISKCRFSFWQPIWFYTPRGAFPTQRMMKARFLGFSPDQGDEFTYVIATEPDDPDGVRQIYTRSVIRPRYLREDAPVVQRNRHHFNIYRGETAELLAVSDGEDLPTTLRVGASNHLLPTIDEEPPEIDSVDEYERCLEEAFGPSPSKRLRVDSTTGGTLRTDPEEPQPTSDSNVQTTCQPNPLDNDEHETPDPDPIPIQPVQNAVPASTIDLNSAEGQDDSTGPVLVTQEEPVPSDDPPDTDSISDDASVDSADEDLDRDNVTAESIDSHLRNLAGLTDDDDLFDSIDDHQWREGVLHFRVKWATDSTSWHPFYMVREDYPWDTAQYIMSHNVGSVHGTHRTGPHQRWARTFMKKTRRVLRRFVRHAGYSKPMKENEPFQFPKENPSYNVRYTRFQATSTARSIRRTKKTKPGRIRRPLEIKYGIAIPRTVKQALQLDAESGTTYWKDAIEREIGSLVQMNCFTFHPSDYKPGPNSQFAPLRMIFEVKVDGRRKGRLVCGGHLVDPRGISTRSTVVKGISVRLLDMIAHRDNLTILHGDVGNAFITANCLEEIHSVAGPEFGDREGAILVINKALYGLRTSSRAYRETFAAFMRTIGFEPSRYDRDVWIRLREDKDGYDYVCTHVDDFKVVAKDPQRWVNAIAGAFQLKCAGAPDYYLGMNYSFDAEQKCWLTGTKTYVNECIARVEALLPSGHHLCPHSVPAPSEGPASHPETDTSDFLDDAGKRQYQMLVGMAQWAVTIGRMDIAFAVASLSRFSAAPRETHMELAFHLFGYLKKYPHKQLPVCSDPLVIDPSLEAEKGPFLPDFKKEYPDAKEDRDPKEPKAYGKPVQTSVFFDANLAHDIKTRRSITGILVYVGSTLVSWTSKRQGCIASSTYCSEFIAMRSAVEEAISVRYMLRSLGIPVEEPTNLLGDNLGVIQSASLEDAELKKKHVAISFHSVREAVAAGIVKPIWCDTTENWADICTKALGRMKLQPIVDATMV